MNSPEDTVRHFWRLMGTNNFLLLKEVLADQFTLEWPQSNERIRGPENFIRMNSEYPTNGIWSFELKRLLSSPTEVVTLVNVTDGEQSAEAISFFQVTAGKITHLVEYWPERYAPPANRAHLTEPISNNAQGAA